jgi:hypothetical protein
MENTQIENTTDVIEDINEETLLSLDETLELDQEQTEIAEGKCKKEGEDMEDEEESDEDEKEDEEECEDDEEEMTEAKKMTEAEVSSDEEFTSYAKGILKAAHGDNYDEAKAMAAIEGILKKADGDYGSAIGMITSGLGEEEIEDEKEVEMKEAEQAKVQPTITVKYMQTSYTKDGDAWKKYVANKQKQGIRATFQGEDEFSLTGPFNKVRAAVISHYYGDKEEAEDLHPEIKKKDMKEETEEVIEENTISIDTSDITRLVESETGLTEEFKEKATIIFEAAVKSKLKETEETLKESYAVALIEEVETIKEELVEKIDNYLTYAVESWVEDNKVAIEGGLRTQIAENFIQSLKTVFVENYIEVPESKQDLVAEMETSIAQLQTESSELENTVLALNEKVNSLTREKVISESTTDLADTQVEKLKSLLEDIECTSETSFRKKVATIKEFYLNGAAVEETLVEENANESSYITTETVIENETIAEETVSPAMQKYLTALSRLNKANEATVPVR